MTTNWRQRRWWWQRQLSYIRTRKYLLYKQTVYMRNRSCSCIHEICHFAWTGGRTNSRDHTGRYIGSVYNVHLQFTFTDRQTDRRINQRSLGLRRTKKDRQTDRRAGRQALHRWIGGSIHQYVAHRFCYGPCDSLWAVVSSQQPSDENNGAVGGPVRLKVQSERLFDVANKCRHYVCSLIGFM